MDGVIVVDKPEGWTSHDVVNRTRRLAGTRKVGHLGTLDPLATGVLPLVVGRATRLAQFYMQSDKVYDAVVQFGWATDTYDRDGTPTSERTEPVVERGEVQEIARGFRGVLEQIPPPISAKKVGGTPAYRLARRQVPVELKPVQVHIYSFEVLECEGARARIKVHCSAGTYLRAVAHEMGRALGCGAFLHSLRRIASGDFTIDMARTLEELDGLARDSRLAEAFIPAARLLPAFPTEVVDEHTAGRIRQGRDFQVSPFRVQHGARHVKAVTRNGELVAIGEARLPNVYHPVLVL